MDRAAAYLGGERDTAVAVFLLMVMERVVVVAVRFAVIVAGAKTHVASDGRPQQANVIVPLKLLELVTLTDVVPDPPGPQSPKHHAILQTSVLAADPASRPAAAVALHQSLPAPSGTRAPSAAQRCAACSTAGRGG